MIIGAKVKVTSSDEFSQSISSYARRGFSFVNCQSEENLYNHYERTYVYTCFYTLYANTLTITTTTTITTTSSPSSCSSSSTLLSHVPKQTCNHFATSDTIFVCLFVPLDSFISNSPRDSLVTAVLITLIDGERFRAIENTIELRLGRTKKKNRDNTSAAPDSNQNFIGSFITFAQVYQTYHLNTLA